jgi:GT2 family glycosyltransferase
MKTVLCVPVHNAVDHFKLLMEDIAATVARSVPVILVNDCSDEQTVVSILAATMMFSGDRTMRMLSNGRQQLFTRTVNRGIRCAYHEFGAELVYIINTDCRLENGWFEELTNAFLNPNVGMAGYWDEYPKDVDWAKKPFTEIKIPGYVTGHCFGLRLAMLKEIGVLSETDIDGRVDRNLAGLLGQAHIGSERILCNRANIAGWQTLYVNRPLVHHGQGASWGRNLGWLSQFKLEPLWEANDTLELEKFV